MNPTQVAKLAVFAHTALVVLVVFYVTRVWNYTPLSEMPSRDTIAFAATAIPPIAVLWIGGWFARGDRARRLFATGMVMALMVYVAAFLLVLNSDEPLAPLLLILTSIWQAGGLLILLLAVWLTGRFAR